MICLTDNHFLGICLTPFSKGPDARSLQLIGWIRVKVSGQNGGWHQCQYCAGSDAGNQTSGAIALGKPNRNKRSNWAKSTVMTLNWMAIERCCMKLFMAFFSNCRFLTLLKKIFDSESSDPRFPKLPLPDLRRRN